MTRHATIHAALLTEHPLTIRQLMLKTKMPTGKVKTCLRDLEELKLARPVEGIDGECWVPT